MFAMTLVDHLRMTFGHVIYMHRAHTQLAWRHARWNRWLEGAEAVLMLIAAFASIVIVFTGQVPYGVVAAIAAALAVLTLIIRLVLNFDKSAGAHRVCSARLWHVREQYRALLAELKDESLTLDTARERRDVLVGMLNAIYENAPPADRGTYEAARGALPGAHDEALSDEEVDRFLPPSLQKSGKPAA